MERFRGGLVLKAHRPLYHSTLGSRVIKKKKKYPRTGPACAVQQASCSDESTGATRILPPSNPRLHIYLKLRSWYNWLLSWYILHHYRVVQYPRTGPACAVQHASCSDESTDATRIHPPPNSVSPHPAKLPFLVQMVIPVVQTTSL